MCVQFFFSLKVKYPKNFSVRVVSRYAWMDVNTVEFEIGFSSQHSMNFMFDPYFMRTNLLWLLVVASPARAVAYLHQQRDLT